MRQSMHIAHTGGPSIADVSIAGLVWALRTVQNNGNVKTLQYVLSTVELFLVLFLLSWLLLWTDFCALPRNIVSTSFQHPRVTHTSMMPEHECKSSAIWAWPQIDKDLRPISVVDGQGFTRLLNYHYHWSLLPLSKLGGWSCVYPAVVRLLYI